eukprot:CAMPEP_0174363106 /NCGR_PEP_ID=MMETSP0811_2-20130205/67379_1 /TAXON_ID=73025 ORGANISM="Eutreptiella gymnastica-like, Strain CCMP1594" /NCGR_SAMPLE_ID=MMETSP0811_2 /ASSEMBLY_ACC=CAM_ASM_000667 /LENGTH=65 /DNA_ID=CAMNT_0015501453 /DNA_START=307 /DNA_END=501 /DNA_ORIENTATION=-
MSPSSAFRPSGSGALYNSHIQKHRRTLHTAEVRGEQGPVDFTMQRHGAAPVPRRGIAQGCGAALT